MQVHHGSSYGISIYAYERMEIAFVNQANQLDLDQ